MSAASAKAAISCTTPLGEGCHSRSGSPRSDASADAIARRTAASTSAELTMERTPCRLSISSTCRLSGGPRRGSACLSEEAYASRSRRTV
eukprot:3255932-Prymnesium_polylepis.1